MNTDEVYQELISLPYAHQMGSHIKVLRDVLTVAEPNCVTEYGGGLFSTRLFLAYGVSVTTVEQGLGFTILGLDPVRLAPGSDVAEDKRWIREMRNLYGDDKNWNLVLLPGPVAWKRHALIADFVFADGYIGIRHEIVQHALQRNIETVAGHDAEVGRYDAITPPLGYRVFEWCGLPAYTRLWTRNERLADYLAAGGYHEFV